MQTRDHWEQVYSSKATDSVGWYQAHAAPKVNRVESALKSVEPGGHGEEAHHTPAGKMQKSVYCYCRKIYS